MIRQLADVLIQEHLLGADLRELDFASVWQAAEERPEVLRRQNGCATCRGLSGPILDMAELVRGKTFTVASGVRDGVLELRQYTSTVHEDDLDNVPPMDAIAVFERLSKVEEFLLNRADASDGANDDSEDTTRRGWVTIAERKRPGQHGYQRVRFHREPPALTLRDHRHQERTGASLPGLLEMQNPDTLTLGEFRGGLTAMIPEACRRPFEIIVYFRPSASGWLHEITGDQRWGLAQAVREITGALRLELTVRGHPESYRWALHCGPGQEVYVRIVADPAPPVSDGPAEWCEVLKDHLGVH